MIGAKLIEMIEIHASQLSRDIATELITNERTPGFRVSPIEELTPRLFEVLHHLGDWIGDPRSVQVKNEFMMWGAKRFDQRIPLRQVVYGIMLFKQHLRRYIADNGDPTRRSLDHVMGGRIPASRHSDRDGPNRTRLRT